MNNPQHRRVVGVAVKLCACGCRRPVTGWRKTARWATPACVPINLRAEWGRKGRRNAMYRRRRAMFEAVFADMTRGGRTIAKEDIFDAFMVIARANYLTGYGVCETKWKGRQWPARTAKIAS